MFSGYTSSAFCTDLLLLTNSYSRDGSKSSALCTELLLITNSYNRDGSKSSALCTELLLLTNSYNSRDVVSVSHSVIDSTFFKMTDNILFFL